MKHSQLKTILMILIILVYLVYSGHYIYQTSHIIDGVRYFNLNDDAMISMRYAKNLANGDGLVWNPGGERIEGFSNPLWVAYMAVIHLFPIPASKISLVIQITGAALMIVTMLLVKKITETLSDNPFVILGAVVLTGFYGPLNNWSLMGMEVSILVVLVCWAILSALRNLKSGKFSPKPYIILGIGTLVRFDMAVPLLVLIAFFTLVDPNNRKNHLFWGISLLTGFLLGQTLLRLWYYGQPLPNTYYLKVTGTPLYVRLGKGLYVFGKLFWQTNWIIALLPMAIFSFRRDKPVYLLFVVFLGQIAYSIYVGGDAWEHMGGANRYISLGMPAFFILFSLAAGYLSDVLAKPIESKPRLASWAKNLGLTTFLFLSLINVNIRVDTNSLLKWLALKPPEFSVASRDYIQIAHAIEKITTEDASIAVKAAGTIPYFVERETVDLLGKVDPVIARIDSHLEPGWSGIKKFQPGHSKWDAMHSVVVLQPDLLIHLVKDPTVTNPDALSFVEENYLIIEIDGYSFTALANSPHILWDAADRVYSTIQE